MCNNCGYLGYQGMYMHGGTTEMYKAIRTLNNKLSPQLNVIKDTKGETNTEHYDILAKMERKL